jgi:hypothetical protein
MRAIGRNARHGEYVPEWNGEPVINHIFESAGQVSDHAADYGENPSARHETDGARSATISWTNDRGAWQRLPER